MGRILQAILLLLILAMLGLVAYAYLGDLRPDAQEQRLDVALPGGVSGN